VSARDVEGWKDDVSKIGVDKRCFARIERMETRQFRWQRSTSF